MDDAIAERGFNRVYSVLDSHVYREALRVSSPDPVPEWVVPYSFLQASELEQIAEYLEVCAHSMVVDLGCGLGGAAQWIAERTGARITGVDFSTEAVARARERARERGMQGHVTFITAEMTQTGLAGEGADGVMSVDAIMFAEPQAACDEIARLLRPGGKVAIFAIEPQKPQRETAVPDYRPYFERAGLRIDVRTPMPSWPQNRDRFFAALLERAERLREELGEGADSLLEEAQSVPGPSQRVFIGAEKS